MSNSPISSNPLPPVLSSEDVAALTELATPLFSDNMDRLVGSIGLNRYNGSGKLVGTALTVKTRPGDNLGIYQALATLKPGHVIVVDAGGGFDNALAGDLMRAYAVSRGCAGFVIDGAVRDIATYASGSFPCYARGVSHRGPYKTGPAHVNVPVSIGGQVVNPGDVIVGDEDGVVCFSPTILPQIIAAARAKFIAEQAIMAEIASGVRHQSWLHGVLEANGVEIPKD